MQEQRLTLRLKKYWELLKKDKQFPDIAHFSSTAVDEIWPYCLRLAVDKQPDGQQLYKHEYVGPAIIKLYGEDPSGTVIDQNTIKFPGKIIVGGLGEAGGQGAPAETNGQMVDKQGKLTKYRACFLPFGTEQDGVTHVIVRLSYSSS